MTHWLRPDGTIRGTLVGAAALLAALVACESDGDSPSATTTDDTDAATGDVSMDDAGAVDLEGGGAWSCELTNPFSGSPECKSYTGGSWDLASAMADCAEGQYGEPGGFGTDPCDVGALMGVCDVPSYFGQEYRLVLGGTNPDFCTATARACTNFSAATSRPPPPARAPTYPRRSTAASSSSGPRRHVWSPDRASPLA